MMKLRILKDFNYGSVSDPQKMLAGNVVESNSVDGMTEEKIAHMKAMKWVEEVE
jgi:hypothetical protein